MDSVTQNEYEKRLRDMVSINPLYHLQKSSIWELLEEAKPIIVDGHFEMHGFHSDMYMRMQAISQYPYWVTKISNEISWWAGNCLEKFNVTLAPSSQGMFFGFDLASKTKGVRAVFSKIEPETGRPKSKFHEGFDIDPGEKVVIVNDINMTGYSLEKLIEMVELSSAKVEGICVFADISRNSKLTEKIKKRYNFHSIVDLNLPFWSAGHCKQKCNQAKPLITMEQINHLPIYGGDVAYENFLKKLAEKKQ
jgi:orotate phosphoribosyltransferase